MEFRCLLMSVLLVAASGYAQITAKPIEANGMARVPNTQGIYAALRAGLPDGAGVSVKDFTLEREGGAFHFEQGNFYLYAPVNGRVTGAVFVGKGRFELEVKSVSEKRLLTRLTKNDMMTQDFTTLVLRFTDGTAEQIQKASAGVAGSPDGHVRGAAEDLAKGFRRQLQVNLELRLLGDVIGGQQGGFFLASFRMGGMLLGRNVLFLTDPEGTFHASPDEVELSTWGDDGTETWAAYRMQHVEAKDRGLRLRVTDEKLDVTFGPSGTMKSSAETTLIPLRAGVRVVQLNMYPTLRVSGVFDENGIPLDFVQEGKDFDSTFAVILPKAATQGQPLRILTKYAGPDALLNVGEGSYYLLSGARDSWYPSGLAELGDFANFRMTFHLAKTLQIVATGKQISLTPEDKGMMRAVWATDAPIPVAGFNLGDFKTSGTKTPQGFAVDAFANVNIQNGLTRLSNQAMLATTPQLKKEVAQGSEAIQVYSDFFGKLPYDHVALTQQASCSYGQSWPMLVYLPMCGFWDSTTQQEFGLLDEDRTYWTEVTPHEVSHQWWGNLVGFNSYRDQWMSEGFANFSVGLFLLNTNSKGDEYHAFWKEQQKNLLQKNKFGLRPIDVGPLTMGGRVSNSKTGNVYQLLIYSKGAYVVHMMEMAYWTSDGGETAFKHSMQEFVKEYAGKAATTEDWKASLEKTMPKSLNLRGDGKLDWFFDEYVYGTELPHYAVTSQFTVANGETSVHWSITQSNVSKNFVMLVPLYLQMENGTTARIANVPIHGDATIEHTSNLGKLPSAGKAILFNYNADVLSDN